MIKPEIVDGDLLDQPVEVIVNAWNRNLIPWWLLCPQGVSGAIKKWGGIQPFVDVRRAGLLPSGGAFLTGAGRLTFKGIIHVAGINLLWRSTRQTIQGSVCSAMGIVNEQKFSTVAFPVIGSGSGGVWGLGQAKAMNLMLEAFNKLDSQAAVYLVRYRKQVAK